MKPAANIPGLTLTIWAVASAQSFMDPERIAAAREAFESAATAQPLHCVINHARPALNFSLRFQTGYVIDFALNQFQGAAHDLKILARVTPDGREPSFLISTANLGDVPGTKLDGQVVGAFLVGEGAYSVEALVEDDLQRVCHSKWRIQAKLTGSERDLKLTVPPETVGELSAHGPGDPESTVSRRIDRLTLMIHAAPLSARRSTLQADDVVRLVGSLSSLLEQMPARAVRVIVFNLDQHAVLFRKADFAAKDLDQVTTAINQLQLGTVDYRTLQQRDRSIDFLSDLLQAERRDPKPPDAVILLGPRTRAPEGAPLEGLDKRQTATPQLFYVQYRSRQPILYPGRTRRGSGREPSAAEYPHPNASDDPAPSLSSTHELPDSIQQLVSRLKGESIIVRTPHDFSDAIRHMAARIPTTQ
jgi:hypothetical protein